MGEITQTGDDVGGVQESLAIRSEPGEEAHEWDRWRVDQPHDGGPYEEEAHEALDGAGGDHHPGTAEGGGPFGGGGGGGGVVRGDGGVEEAGEDAEVGADVLEDGDGVEGGLVVALSGL